MKVSQIGSCVWMLVEPHKARRNSCRHPESTIVAGIKMASLFLWEQKRIQSCIATYWRFPRLWPVKNHVTTGTMRCTWTLICKGSKGNAAQLWSINGFSVAFLATLTLSPYLSSPEPSSGRENRWWFSRVWLQYENIPIHYNLCYVFRWSGLWWVCDVWVSFPVHRFYSWVPGTVGMFIMWIITFSDSSSALLSVSLLSDPFSMRSVGVKKCPDCFTDSRLG